MLVGIQVDSPLLSAVHQFSNNTLSTAGGNPVVYWYDPAGAGNNDAGVETINNFGAGYSIQVVGENFTGGTVTTGDGAGVALKSIQIAVSGGNTTLYASTAAVTSPAANPLPIHLNGVYQTSDFLLDGEYIRYRDTAPNAFTFTAQTGGAPSAVTTSNAATIAGINSAANISIVGGEYAVSTDSGSTWSAWSTNTHATVSLNDQVKVRLTSNSGYSALASATLTVGGVNGVFNVTTGSAPYYPTPPPNSTLPTGGGTASPMAGQTVTVTDNGGQGSSVNLPPPPTGGTGTATPTGVNVILPGTGTISVSSNVVDTQLGVAKVTLPGATGSVNTITVDKGSASFTATEKGQAVAGLKNGIIVVSGAKDSQISVDATGPNTTITHVCHV